MIKKGKNDVWDKIQAGDKSAFDEVYHAHIDSLYNYGTSFTSDIPLIEDAIQEVFVTIWSKKATIFIHSNIKSYLFTALRRQIIDLLNRQKKIEVKREGLKLDIRQNSIQSVPLDRIDSVKKEISKLSRREREAIVLKYQEGLSYKEMAILMNLKNQAIYKLVSSGIKKIRANLGAGIFLLLSAV